MQLVEEKPRALELYPDRIVENKCDGYGDEVKTSFGKNKQKEEKYD